MDKQYITLPPRTFKVFKVTKGSFTNTVVLEMLGALTCSVTDLRAIAQQLLELADEVEGDE